MYSSAATTITRNGSRLVSRAQRSLLEREVSALKRQFSKKTVSEASTKSSLTKWKVFDNANPFMNDRRKYLGMSISELLGNVSFVFATTAYLNTDILHLRALAMSSITLGMIFQFYRTAPLWLPIRWNFLLLGINGFMVANLLFERHQANSMPPQLERILQEGNFEKRGFSRVEFCQLFRVGNQVRYKAGEFLTRDGKENRKLYFVIKGKVSIMRKRTQLATVTPYNFVGELAFLNYKLDDDEDAFPLASADAVVEEDEIVVCEWDFGALQAFLKGEREVSNALSAYVNHDLRNKLINTGVSISDLDNTDGNESPCKDIQETAGI